MSATQPDHVPSLAGAAGQESGIAAKATEPPRRKHHNPHAAEIKKHERLFTVALALHIALPIIFIFLMNAYY